MTEPAADLLRRAAHLIEQHAEHATPGPWEIGHDYLKPDQASHLFVGCGPANCNNVDCYDGTHGIGYLDTDGDVRWAALMHPRLAAPLAAWLRSEASEAAYFDSMGIDTPSEATAFARVLLGEDQP